MGIDHGHCQRIVGSVELDDADDGPRLAGHRLGLAQQTLEVRLAHSSGITSVLGREPEVVPFCTFVSTQHRPSAADHLHVAVDDAGNFGAENDAVPTAVAVCSDLPRRTILSLSASCAKRSFHLPSGYKRQLSVAEAHVQMLGARLDATEREAMNCARRVPERREVVRPEHGQRSLVSRRLPRVKLTLCSITTPISSCSTPCL
eukprot:4841910-Prymnesium_polylepis.1